MAAIQQSKKRFRNRMIVYFVTLALSVVYLVVSIRLISDGNDDAHMEAYKNFWKTAGDESFRMVHSFLESI